MAAQRDALAGATAGVSRVGLEADHVTWAAVRSWEEVLAPCDLRPTRGLVERLRAVKDQAELVRMARAAAVADAALAAVLELLAAAGGAGPAPTEAEVAAALDHAMRAHGAEDRAFETIVASGPNSAKPHARPTERPLAPGDPVVIDFGATVDGYRSDMARTFCLGEPTGSWPGSSPWWPTPSAGVAAVGPGVVAGDVDRASRDVVAAAGWAERFEHGTGHGVGLDIHEAPSVGPGSTAILEPGSVVTVEPGVYLPGVGGVRIEDTLVVTEHGSRPLTLFPKEVVV